MRRLRIGDNENGFILKMELFYKIEKSRSSSVSNGTRNGTPKSKIFFKKMTKIPLKKVF
jgi:hypothetical protein